MANFVEISPSEMTGNVFDRIGKDWMLVTAGNADKCNTMTASWGGLGVLWNGNVSYIFVRPSRYTYAFLEQEEYYSLSFFGPDHRRALQVCGSVSGRDTDKLAAAGLTPRFDAEAPCFEEAALTVVCRKLYYQDLDPANFLDPAILQHYRDGDVHRVYVGEIVRVLQQQ